MNKMEELKTFIEVLKGNFPQEFVLALVGKIPKIGAPTREALKECIEIAKKRIAQKEGQEPAIPELTEEEKKNMEQILKDAQLDLQEKAGRLSVYCTTLVIYTLFDEKLDRKIFQYLEGMFGGGEFNLDEEDTKREIFQDYLMDYLGGGVNIELLEKGNGIEVPFSGDRPGCCCMNEIRSGALLTKTPEFVDALNELIAQEFSVKEPTFWCYEIF